MTENQSRHDPADDARDVERARRLYEAGDAADMSLRDYGAMLREIDRLKKGGFSLPDDCTLEGVVNLTEQFRLALLFEMRSGTGLPAYAEQYFLLGLAALQAAVHHFSLAWLCRMRGE